MSSKKPTRPKDAASAPSERRVVSEYDSGDGFVPTDEVIPSDRDGNSVSTIALMTFRFLTVTDQARCAESEFESGGDTSQTVSESGELLFKEASLISYGA